MHLERGDYIKARVSRVFGEKKWRYFRILSTAFGPKDTVIDGYSYPQWVDLEVVLLEDMNVGQPAGAQLRLRVSDVRRYEETIGEGLCCFFDKVEKVPASEALERLNTVHTQLETILSDAQRAVLKHTTLMNELLCDAGAFAQYKPKEQVDPDAARRMFEEVDRTVKKNLWRMLSQ
ncbi:hypothetical protein FJY93_04770 [Candidatus Kaiserbacteria bacterium]|nr:hypothetical protein [Candidatus Kaiserbacteria bacterium]